MLHWFSKIINKVFKIIRVFFSNGIMGNGIHLWREQGDNPIRGGSGYRRGSLSFPVGSWFIRVFRPIIIIVDSFMVSLGDRC
jgi:hypothetical protein